MAKTKGCDVSHWQGMIDFEKMRSAGAEFVFIKRSQKNLPDIKGEVNWIMAREAGLLRGAYHFADYRHFPKDQAEYFAELLGDDLGELPPMLDYELRIQQWGRPEPISKNLLWILEFVKTFEDLTDIKPIIYTNPAFIKYNLPQEKPGWLLEHDLWIAHYLPFPALRTPNYNPWDTWKFWQYGTPADGLKFGAESKDIDMNYFNGSKAELEQYSIDTMFPDIPIEPPELPVIDLPAVVGHLQDAKAAVDNLHGLVDGIGGV